MSSGVPYLGSKISLISKSEIRYEGILYTIDTKESTVALAKVRSFGTEDRPTERPVAPRDDVYEYIIFRASDIKDLHVCEAPHPQPPANSTLPNDPAIVQHSAPVANQLSAPFSPPGVIGSFGPIGAIPSSQSYVSPQAGLPNIPQPFVAPGSQHSDSRSETPTHTPLQSKSPTLDDSLSGIGGTTRSEASKENKPPSSQRMMNRMSQPGTSGTQSQRRGFQNQSGERFQQRHQQQQQHHNYQQQHHNYQQQQHHNYQQQQHHNYQQQHHNYQYHNHHQQQQQDQQSPHRDYYSNNQRRGRSQGGSRNRQNFSGRSKVLQFDEEYDFEQANAEFQELEGKLAKIKLDSPTPNSLSETDEKKEEQIWPDNGSGDAPTTDDDDSIYYDRSKSFFDNISCEAVERSKGNIHRHDWRQERKLNVETFGVSSSNTWRRNPWRGGRGFRPRVYRGGSGGGGRGYSMRGHRGGGSGSDRNNGRPAWF